MLAAKPGQLKFLEQTEVGIILPRSGQNVPSHVPEHPRLSIGGKLAQQRLGSHSRVKPGRSGAELGIIGAPLQNPEMPRQIAPITQSDPGAEPADSAVEVNRIAGTKRCNTTHLPASQRLLQEAVWRVPEERQIVNVVHHKYVGPVQRRGAIPPAKV